MANTGDLYKGAYIRFNGELCQVIDLIHRTPGNLRAFYQVILRNVKNGNKVEHRFRAGEGVELVRVEYREMQYLYKENTSMVVMDPETFEQIYIDQSMIGDSMLYVKEEMMVKVFFEGDNIISAEPPTFVELLITYTEPGVKGDSANSSLKPATLETGAIVMVPLFLNTDDKIKVDTRDGSYMEKVK